MINLTNITDLSNITGKTTNLCPLCWDLPCTNNIAIWISLLNTIFFFLVYRSCRGKAKLDFLALNGFVINAFVFSIFLLTKLKILI